MNTSHYHSLYTFTKLRILDARRAAKNGRKDEARDILRYVRNASILDILRPIDFGTIFNVDIAHLQWQLDELELECHPASQADFKDDFTAIRAHVETLAGGMSLILDEIRSRPKA
jgi:hypothetical protein